MSDMLTAPDTEAKSAEEAGARTAAEYAADLRELADIIERSPAFAATGSYGMPPTCAIAAFVHNAETMVAHRRELGGLFRKRYIGDWIELSRAMSNGHVRIELTAARAAVCERVVVGVETIPAQHVKAHTIPAATKELVEWRCGSLLEDES